jgi:microtubule-associated protein-like 6
MLDWSQDSSTVVFNTQAGELMWYDVSSSKGNRIMAGGAKEIEWNSWTCKFGHCVQGIFADGPEYSNVKGVCRSNDRQLLATSDVNGKLNLFRWPCAMEGAGRKQFSGHSSFVTKVAFSCDDKYLITVGGNDKTVIIWEQEGH